MRSSALLACAALLALTRSAAADEPVSPPIAETVVVTLDTDEPARLEARTGPSTWETVCFAPCNVAVPLEREVRIAGDGIRHSRPFHLEGHGHVVLTLSSGTNGGLTAGILLVSAGPALLVAGFVLALDSLSHTMGDAPPSGSSGAHTEGNIAGSLLVGGLVVTAVGVPVGVVTIVHNARSHVEQAPSTDDTRTPEILSGLERKAPERRFEGPRAAAIPIFSASF